MTPSELLFEQPLGQENRPLFESQTDLVRLITQTEGSEWTEKKFKSVRAFVNQVINGERKLSPSLKEAIFLVLPLRLGAGQDEEAIRQQIEETFFTFFREKKQTKKYDRYFAPKQAESIDSNDFYLLEKRGLVADTVLVTTRQPELLNNNNWARELKSQMLGKLGVLPHDGTKAARYTYFFPPAKETDDKAFRFWKELFSFMKYERNLSDTENILSELNTTGRLRIFEAPPLLCSFPIIIYDLDTRSEVGFTVFDYVDKGLEKISTARISPAFLKWWKTDVYTQLAHPDESPDITEMTFASVLRDLRKDEVLL